MRKVVTIVCEQCGKEFQRLKKWVDSNSRRRVRNVCSQACRALSHQNGEDFKCAACGKQVYKSQSRAARTKSGDIFCSKSCSNGANNSLRSGENHPNYINGIGRYRQLAFEVYGKKCTICGYDVEQVLEVHHRNKDRSNNTKENLDVLCPTHHEEFDLGIRKYSVGESSNPIGQTALNR